MPIMKKKKVKRTSFRFVTNEREIHSFYLKQTGIIVTGIVSSILLIGLFWGKEGLQEFGVVVFVILLFLIAIMSSSPVNKGN